jgi:phage antirepressor YoqD-like protein
MKMNKLIPIEHKNQRVMTSAQLAESYNTDEQKIKQNFNNHKDRYTEGMHYYVLKGEELKVFKGEVENIDLAQNINTLYLWTEKGALTHAKSINNDTAWEVYGHLVDTYFRARDMFSIPKTLPEALRMAAELAEKIEQDKPKVLLAETILSSDDSILIREMAKLCSKRGKTIGQNNLFRWMRKRGLLNSQNEPYQEYIDRGYFEVIERPIHTNDGVILKFTTKVLPKGQEYIIKHLSA